MYGVVGKGWRSSSENVWHLEADSVLEDDGLRQSYSSSVWQGNLSVLLQMVMMGYFFSLYIAYPSGPVPKPVDGIFAFLCLG